MSLALNPSSFVIHDVAAFPVVWCRTHRMQPGFSIQWEAEMDALLINARPFVVIFDPGEIEESHEDRKQRGLWLKRNKQAMSGICIGVISIEPDLLQRAAMIAQSLLAAKAFGVATEVAVSIRDAEDKAAELLWTPARSRRDDPDLAS
jgi:hypothetical protein